MGDFLKSPNPLFKGVGQCLQNKHALLRLFDKPYLLLNNHQLLVTNKRLHDLSENL